MNWIFLILFGLIFVWAASYLFYGRNRNRRRAENVLGPDGWPRPENREGEKRNDHE